MICMKRNFRCFVVCLFVVVAVPSAYALADNRIVLGASVGTGAVFYGDDSISDLGDGFSRFVFEGDVSAGFVLDSMVRFVLGAVSACDFHVQNGSYANLIDYAFYGGIRVYLGLAGLCVGVDYALGRRTDFVQLGDERDGVSSTGWGNGFRFLAEYDFTSGGTGFAPVVGCGWRHMPRGGSSDNIISLYFRIAYR